MLALSAAIALVGYRPLPGPSLHYARHYLLLSSDEQTRRRELFGSPEIHNSPK
jgi:hypothetical protein